MMKSLITSLFILTVNCAIAQKASITWGTESKTELTYYSFVGGSGNDLIKLCFEEKGRSALPVITRYNNKLQEQAVNSFSVNENGVKFDKFLSIKGHLYFFTNLYDNRSRTTGLFCQPLNIQTFNKEGANINIATVNALNKYALPTVTYLVSKDSSKVLMMSLSSYEKNKSEKYNLSIHDQAMSKLWETTVELPYKDKYVRVLSTVVTNDGKVGVLIKHYDKETTNEEIKVNGKKAPSYSIKLLLYSKNEPKPQELIITTDKFIQDIAVAEEVGNDLTLFGMYKSAEGYTTGYFLVKINKENKQVKLGPMNPFPESVCTDKKGKANKGELKGIGLYSNFVKVITRDNGDKDYLLETQIVAEIRGSSVGGAYSYIEYRYGGIIDINVKQDGNTIITKIPKNQYSAQTKAISFQALPYKDKLILFYNDHYENLGKGECDESELVVPEKAKNVAFTMASIDATGKVTKSVLFGTNTSNLIIATNVCFPVEKNKIALYANKGSIFTKAKDMIGLLELK